MKGKITKMMHFHRALAAIIMATTPLLVGCATGGNVTVLSDAPASGLGSSYAWAKSTTSGDPRVDNDIVRDRMESAIERAMTAKGYRKADAATADILLAYHVGIRDGSETRVDQTPSVMAPPVMCGRFGCSSGYRWGYYGAPAVSVREIQYTEGSLMVNVHDRATEKLVWRAVYDQRLTGKGGDQTTFDKAAAAALKTLPAAR